MKELTIEATVQNLQQVLDFVDGVLETMNCPMKLQMQMDVAVEELYVNVASYAYAPGTGNVTVRIEKLADPAAIEVTFIDSGVPFDPTAREDPDVHLSAEERKIGGLGIYMVKKSMDTMTYEYTDGKNILSISKNL